MKIAIYTAVAIGLITPTAVVAQQRVLLWDRVEAGMTIAELRAIYPEDGERVKYHGDSQTEIEDVTIIEGCEAEVEIAHEDGVVNEVKVKGRGSMAGRCSDQVLGALSARYGEPLVQRGRSGNILERQGEIVQWTRAGALLRFKQFTNGVFGGAGLGQSSWELTYSAIAAEINL